MRSERRGGMGRRLAGGGLLLVLAVSLTGCWDFREPNKVGFIEALGVDRTTDGHVELSALIAIPSAQVSGGGGGGGGGDSGKRPLLLQTARGRTLSEALLNMNRFTSRVLTVSQCRVVVFSEEVARRGLTPYIGLLTRWYEFRSTMVVLITEGRASECLRIESPLERDPVEFFVNLVSMVSPSMGVGSAFQVQDLLHVMGNYEGEPVAPLVAPYQSGAGPSPGQTSRGTGPEAQASSGSGGKAAVPKNAVQFKGLAMFQGSRMVGKLDALASSYYLMLVGRHQLSFQVVPDPLVRGNYVMVQAKAIKRDVRVRRVYGRPELDISLEVPLDLVEVQSTVDYTGRRNRPLLERAVAEKLGRGCRQVVAQAQRRFRTDIFQFGTFFRVRFLTWPAWVKYDWLHKQFPRAKINVTVEARLRRPGATFRPLRPVLAPARPGSAPSEQDQPGQDGDGGVQHEQAEGAPPVPEAPRPEGVDGRM
ncbi:MAG TPA: Ger(x)C family spore germination protein [Firmicutes bacterium]|nr:Ger(x)C family spore germination protein [Bacillota bacterium]